MIRAPRLEYHHLVYLNALVRNHFAERIVITVKGLTEAGFDPAPEIRHIMAEYGDLEMPVSMVLGALAHANLNSLLFPLKEELYDAYQQLLRTPISDERKEHLFGGLNQESRAYFETVAQELRQRFDDAGHLSSDLSATDVPAPKVTGMLN